MSEKENFLSTWEREFQITMKVLKHYPEDKLDLKPAEKLRDARNLLWVFVSETSLIDMAIQGEIKFGSMPEAPNTLGEILSAFQAKYDALVAKIKDIPDEELNATVKFMVGPGQIVDLRKLDIFWITIMDMIHHRGQISVYSRIAGGIVPSIYGPSADEPWN